MTQAADDVAVQAWCMDYLARVLRRPADGIDPAATFSDLGVDSAEMLFMVSALEDRWRLDLASDVPLDYPTVLALSRYIAGLMA